MNYYDFLTTSNIGSFTFVTQKADLSEIDRVEFYPPATKLILKDGTSYVSVAQDGDVFDKVSGVEQCLLQYAYNGKSYHGFVRNLIRQEENLQKEKERKLAEEKEAKERHEKEIAEKRAKRAEKERKQREYEIEIRKEAYLRAMKERELCKN